MSLNVQHVSMFPEPDYQIQSVNLLSELDYQSDIKILAKDVEELLRKDICHVKVFTQQFALMRQMLEPFSREESQVWKDVKDLRAFKEQIDNAKQVIKLCQLHESVIPADPKEAGRHRRLLPAPVNFARDTNEVSLSSLLKDVGQRRQPPQDQQEARMWEIQEKKEEELQPTQLEKGSFPEDLLGENNFNGSLVQRSLCVAAAAYGKFAEPRHGLGGINEWQDLIMTRSSDLAIFGMKRREAGTWCIEIGIRGTIPDYSDQWFFESGNANIELSDMEGVKGKVHSGFLTAYTEGSPSMQQAIRGKVSKELKNARGRVTEVLVSGHSRGAALSTLCAVDLALYFQDVQDVRVLLVTYASPRVGDSDFVRFCQRLEAQNRLRSARFVNRFDPVPHTPAQHGTIADAVQRFLLGDLGQKSGYEHLGNAIVLDWYSQNVCRLINDAQKSMAGVHDISRYGENLRNRFRDFRSVCLESVAPVAKSVLTFFGELCVSKVAGSAVVTLVKMRELEQTVKNEAKEIKDTVVQQAGLVMNEVKQATKTILDAISQKAVQERVHDLLSRMEVLQTQVRSRMVGVELCTRTHEAVNALLLMVEDVPKDMHEKLLIYVLNALELIGIAYISLGLSPQQLLTWMQEVSRQEKLLQLLAEVCSTKAVDQKLSRRQVQKFLHDFSWPEDKDGGRLIIALQRLQRLIVTVMMMSGERGSLGMHKRLADKVDPGKFTESSGDTWEGWSLAYSENKPNGSAVSGEGSTNIRTEVIIDADGSIYQGGLKDGIPYGCGEVVCMVAGFEAYRYTGGFRMGVMHGQGKYSLPDGTVVHNGFWNHGQPAQASDVAEVLESLSKMQLAMPRKDFQRDFNSAKTFDLENEAAVQNIQRNTADFSGSSSLSRYTSANKLLLESNNEEDEETMGEDLDHQRTKFKLHVRQLITDFSAACIFCDRVKATTAQEELMVLKEIGVESAIFKELEILAKKVSNTKLQIPIMGPVKAGKSTTINAMMALRLSPSDTQPMTVLPMVIEHITDLQSPKFSVPFSEIYCAAAKQVHKWLHQPSLQKLRLNLLGESQDACMQSDGSTENWILTTPEKEVFDSIYKGNFTVEERLDLTDGPSGGYHTVEKLNKLCRIFARAHSFLVLNLVSPRDELKFHQEELSKGGATDDEYEAASELVHKLRGLLNMTDEETKYKVKGCKENDGKKDEGGPGWQKHIPFWNLKDEDKNAKKRDFLKVMNDTYKKLNAVLSEAVVPEWGSGLLAKLLHAGEKEKICPWPRIQIKISIFAQQQAMDSDGGEMPTAFELIDTPGLDEAHLLPEIRDVVKFLMEMAQATIFVCNSRVLNTEAFNDALILVKQIQTYKVPVLALANYMDSMQKKKKIGLCKDIGQQIFGREESGSKVHPVSARSAFLSSRIQRFRDEGRLSALCYSMLKNHMDEKKMSPDEDDIYTALEMVVPMQLSEQLNESDEPDGDELAEALENSIDFLQKRGGFQAFVDQVKTKLAPKALAMEVQSSLIRLVEKKGTLYRLLANAEDAVFQMTQVGKEKEKSEKDWSDFRIAVLEKSKDGFNKEHNEKATKDIKKVLTNEYNRALGENFEKFTPASGIKDEGTTWLAKTEADRTNLLRDAVWEHAVLVAEGLQSRMKDRIHREVDMIITGLNEALSKEIAALNCPKAGLARLLKEATFGISNHAFDNIISGKTIYHYSTQRAKKTWRQFFTFDYGDLEGYRVEKEEVHKNMTTWIEEYLLDVKAKWQDELVQAVTDATAAYEKHLEKLVKDAQEQHEDIKKQQSEPTFHEAQVSTQAVFGLIKESYDKALKLKEQIQEDPFEL